MRNPRRRHHAGESVTELRRTRRVGEGMGSLRRALPALIVAASAAACGGRPAPLAPRAAPPITVEIAPSQALAPADPPAIVPAGGLVLLRPDATVLDAPDERATRSELLRYGALAHAHALELAHPARVVGRAGPYYALATGAPPEGTCYAPRRGIFAELSLTVFVHRDDLLPVLTRPIEQRSGESLVKLDAGVALGPPSRRPGEAHHREAAVAPLSVSVLVPDDAVGLVFHADRAPAPTLTPDAELPGTCAEGACLMWIEGDASARITGPGPLPVARLARHDERTLVRALAPCIEVHATVRERALQPLPDTHTGQGFGTACGGFTAEDFAARAGARVYWPDGRVAGEIGPNRVWMHRYLSDVVGGRRCFKRHPTERLSCGSEGAYLRVCLDDQDIPTIGATRAP
jgi:hypothetical protein